MTTKTKQKKGKKPYFSNKEKKNFDLIELQKVKKIKIRVIGIGGGAGNIVSEIASKISKASFVVANTDTKSLKGCSKKATKFQFGQDLTHGLGTGMDPELARSAARNEKEKIKKICQGQDLCILIACLGGGTGSGAVSTFAKISKEMGNLTYGIFTLPFKFEGEKKIEIAINSLKEVKNNLNIMSIIPNERVFEFINKETPLKESLSIINQFLAQSLGGLIETIYQPGLVNIDFADFRTILEGKGKLAYLNTVEIQKKENAVKDSISRAINSPLYPYNAQGAKGVLFNIVGEKTLPLVDVEQISKTISGLASPEAKIIFGISERTKGSGYLKTVFLATGCAAKIFSSGEKKKKKEVKKSKKKELPVGKKEKPVEEKKQEPDKKSQKIKKAENSNNMEKEKKEEVLPAKEEKKEEQTKQDKGSFLSSAKEKIRKNGIQVKKEIEEVEKELLEKEKNWETPAFLRKK